MESRVGPSARYTTDRSDRCIWTTIPRVVRRDEVASAVGAWWPSEWARGDHSGMSVTGLGEVKIAPPRQCVIRPVERRVMSLGFTTPV